MILWRTQPPIKGITTYDILTMSYPSRPLPSHLRQPSTSGNLTSGSTGQSPILLARISEKKAELENLKQLRDLSAGLAGQMKMLEEKLATLSDGTEGTQSLLIIIMDSWLTDLVISCCSCFGKLAQRSSGDKHGIEYVYALCMSKGTTNTAAVKIPKPKRMDEADGEDTPTKTESELPQTLVRIPTEHAPMLQSVAGGGDAGE